MERNDLLRTEIPDNIKQQLALWRAIKDVIEETELTIKPFKAKLKQLSDAIQHNLSITKLF